MNSKTFKIAIYIVLICISIQDKTILNENNDLIIEFKDSNTLSFEWRNRKPGWIGIGFGGYLMEEVDYHIVYWQQNNYRIEDSWSDDYDTPVQDIYQGGKTSFLNLDYYVDIETGENVLKYDRLIDTGESVDHKFVDGYNHMVAAWVPDEQSMEEHGSYIRVGKVTLDIAGQSVNIALGRYNIFQAHGLILLICWSILNILGYAAARLLKHLPAWIWIHRFTSGITGALTILMGIWAFVERKMNINI